MLIRLTQLPDKLLFSGFASKFSVIARPVRRLVVAIPQLEGKCTEKYPKMGVSAIFCGNRYLVPFNRGIATPVCALARNDSVNLLNTNLFSPQHTVLEVLL